ncbi:MAG: hypothetical protein PHX25_01320 [Candidatus Pacebacteria bacterium]|nr:hypothetical protein [Candidatus Paceibacterota bacterium]
MCRGGISSNDFPLLVCGKAEEREITLVDFGEALDTEKALSKIDRAGYRPATAHEVLALSNAQPRLQRESVIIALGSVCLRNGRYVVVVLAASYPCRFRELYFSEVFQRWPRPDHHPFYFACVRK